MKRIAIIGSCGAGKSTLAKNLGQKLALLIKKYLQYRDNVREDMAAGCKEKLNWEFLPLKAISL